MISFTFGVENVSDEILDSMQKKTNVALLEHCFDALQKSGANRLTGFCLIIGDPAETIETFSKSVRFLRANYKDYKFISLVLIKCYPGSQIYNNAVKSGTNGVVHVSKRMSGMLSRLVTG